MDRLHHAHLARRGAELLEAGHEFNESDDESGHKVLGEAFVLAVAERGHGFLLALRVELVGVGDLFRVAARFALQTWLKISKRPTKMFRRAVDLQEA